MKRRRILSLLLIVAMLACLCVPVSADGELFFVAVNDTIPLTLTVFPTYSGGTLYVPYQVFDSQPCGVTPSYNQTRQTYVLFNRSRQMLFDLAAGTVSDESGSVSTAACSSMPAAARHRTSRPSAPAAIRARRPTLPPRKSPLPSSSPLPTARPCVTAWPR